MDFHLGSGLHGCSMLHGKVYAATRRTALTYRLDLATGKFENPGQAKTPGAVDPAAPTITSRILSAGLLRRPERGRRRDARYARSHDLADRDAARRGRVDETACGSPNMAATAWRLFDPKPEHHQGVATAHAVERALRCGCGQERRRSLDSGSMLNDGVSRLNTATERSWTMPPAHDQHPAGIRRRDRRAAGAVVWQTNHGASIVKVEPLATTLRAIGWRRPVCWRRWQAGAWSWGRRKTSVAWPLATVVGRSVHSDCMGCGIEHEIRFSQGPNNYSLERAEPVMRGADARRGQRPHHVQRDRIGNLGGLRVWPSELRERGRSASERWSRSHDARTW